MQLSKEAKTVPLLWFYSTATWPGDGPYLDAAYQQIVQDRLIPHYKGKNTTVGDRFVEYFSDEKNKKEIMGNFLRLNLYIKDLTVETIEDVPAYTALDLISDIGGCLISIFLHIYKSICLFDS